MTHVLISNLFTLTQMHNIEIDLAKWLKSMNYVTNWMYCVSVFKCECD